MSNYGNPYSHQVDRYPAAQLTEKKTKTGLGYFLTAISTILARYCRIFNLQYTEPSVKCTRVSHSKFMYLSVATQLTC